MGENGSFLVGVEEGMLTHKNSVATVKFNFIFFSNFVFR